MDVKVRAEPNATGVEWTIDGKKPKESVIAVGHKSGPTDLDFKLDDQTRLGLRFNVADPIWVLETEEDRCPSGGIATDQISVNSCDPKRLSIANANSGAARTLHYQLNFVDQSGNTVRVDPVIKNGGGTDL